MPRWLADGANAMADFAATLLGPGLVGLANLFHGNTALALVVAGLIVSAVSWWRLRALQRSRIRRGSVVAALEAARRFLDAAGTQDVRANLMLITKGRLAISWSTTNYEPDELQTTFRRDGQGAASTAWRRGGLTVGVKAPAGPDGDATLDEARQHLRDNACPDAIVTRLAPGRFSGERIVTVLSIPLRGSDDELAGVLNIDDEHAFRESILLTPRFIGAAKDLGLDCLHMATVPGRG